MKSTLLATGCVVGLVSFGCTHNSQVQPIMASSAYADGYALAYPERLSTETDTLAADEQKASELTQKLASRPREQKPAVDPGLLLVIVQQSDDAGRSEAFATANDDARTVREFWDDERGRIVGRANAGAQKQMTEANCGQQNDFSGPIGYALKDGVDKALEKRLRAQNDAQRTIERNKAAIGAQNVPAVQKLADDIALASYLVNVALVFERNRVDRMLGEKSDVDSTLVDGIEREREYQAVARTAQEKKASQERVVELDKSRSMLGPAVQKAETARKDLDPRIENARKQYQAAIEALEKDLKEQADRQKK